MNRVAQGLIGVLLVIVMIGALVVYLRGPGGPPSLAILEVQGEVDRVRGEVFESAAPGMVLAAGDEVRTGPAGTVVIARGSRSPLTLEGSTSLLIESVEPDLVEVRLRRGRMRAKVRPDSGALRVLQQSRSVLATDGEFRVRVDPGRMLAVDAEQGELAVMGVPGAGRLATGKRLVALEGQTARVIDLSPQPLLDVAWPQPSGADEAVVTGMVEPGARVELVLGSSTASVRADAEGRFEVSVAVPEGEHEAEVEVEDAMGRVRRARGTLRRTSTTGPTFELDLDYGGR